MTGLVINGPVARADVPALCERARAALERCGGAVLECDVGAIADADADAATIEALARIGLTARRLGRDVRLRNASVELRLLVDLCGLADVLPAARLGVEPQRQPEQREQPLRVEERVDGRDPPV